MKTLSKVKPLKPVLIALTKKLILEGYTLQKTAKILCLSPKTIIKYSRMITEQTPEEVFHISSITDTILKDTNNKLISSTARKIQEKLKTTTPRLSELTELYDTVNKVGKPTTPGVAVQFNQYSTSERDTFGL